MRKEIDPCAALLSDCCAHTGPITCRKPNQRKRDLYRDPLGYYWCKIHEYRGHLLLWGSQHNYPQIAFNGSVIMIDTGQVGYYVIGDDTCKPDDRQSLWEMAVLAGNDDMIMSAYRYVFSVLEEI